MLQNSKSDVFSIVTEYVEVRQSVLFAFVELTDTVRLICLTAFRFIFLSQNMMSYSKKSDACLLRNNLIVQIFHENIFGTTGKKY